MVASGTDLMVVAMDTTFRRPARFDDEVDVVLEVARLGETSLTSAWRVERAGEVLCSGTITHVCIDPASRSRSASPTTCARPVVRTVTATRYVTPLREGGSLPAIVEADDDGLYVVKFRGAGPGPQGAGRRDRRRRARPRARAAGPELVFVDLPADLAVAEPDQEIQDLLAASAGLNVGMDFLPGALAYDERAGQRLDPELAAAVVWFDALVMNVDRTPRNPNMLVWHGNLWLIDHGAALFLQHGVADLATVARRPFGQIADHVLLAHAASLGPVDARLGALDLPLDAIAELVPEDWVGDRASTRRSCATGSPRRAASPRRRRRPVARRPFQYALLRVVPHVERGEVLNAGVVVFARQHGQFLVARTLLDDARLRALAPGVDPGPIRERLRVLEQVAAGDPAAGPARRAAAVRALPLAHRAGEHGRPGLARPHRAVRGPAGAARPPVRHARRADPRRRPAARLLRARRAARGGPRADLARAVRALVRRGAGRAAVGEATAMVVSTAGEHGPSSRTVLLKGADDRGLVFFTNLRSRKGRELRATGRASLLFPWLALERQVIVTGAVELLAPRGQRRVLRVAAARLPAVGGRQPAVRGRRLARLARAAPRRAGGRRRRRAPEHWGGVRVVPDGVEFWQGRADRLHDRLRFRRDGDAWVVERLAP
jgi:pyridoxamine-phosphate oxidase